MYIYSWGERGGMGRVETHRLDAKSAYPRLVLSSACLLQHLEGCVVRPTGYVLSLTVFSFIQR